MSEVKSRSSLVDEHCDACDVKPEDVVAAIKCTYLHRRNPPPPSTGAQTDQRSTQPATAQLPPKLVNECGCGYVRIAQDSSGGPIPLLAPLHIICRRRVYPATLHYITACSHTHTLCCAPSSSAGFSS